MTMGLHPEESLDRVLAGTANAHEQATVDAHVATCPSCAMQLRVARARDTAAPALASFDAQKNDRVVALAIAELRNRRVTWLGRLRLPRWTLAAAGLLLLAGGASAAWIVHELRTPAPTPEPPLAPLPSLSAPPAPTAEPVENAPPAAPIPAPEPAPARPTPAAPTASALFEQGTALRAQNKRALAIAVFGKLQRAYPESRESRLSFVLVGSLLLEERRPAEALAQFDRHLALRGEAEPEALAGRASAYAQLARGAEEAKAWHRLLAAHPDSIYATRAKQRLAALEGSP